MQPILDRAVANGAGVFIVTRSSNPEGRAIQGARHPGATTVEHQLVIDIAAENARVAPGPSVPSEPCSAPPTVRPPISISPP
jgi:orotidine-5'-phosphate decarboxylase